MHRVSSVAAHRRNVERQMRGVILTIKHGIPVLCISSVINFILDCCGVGMIM